MIFKKKNKKYLNFSKLSLLVFADIVIINDNMDKGGLAYGREVAIMAQANNNFGVFMKRLRLNAGYGLRRFADLIEMPASNLCDIEHGRRSMPKDYLELTAEVLGLEKDTPDWVKFFDLARKSDELPVDVQKIAHRRLIPALLRTVDNAQLSDKELRKLIEDIQGRKNN